MTSNYYYFLNYSATFSVILILSDILRIDSVVSVILVLRSSAFLLRRHCVFFHSTLAVLRIGSAV